MSLPPWVSRDRTTSAELYPGTVRDARTSLQRRGQCHRGLALAARRAVPEDSRYDRLGLSRATPDHDRHAIFDDEIRRGVGQFDGSSAGRREVAEGRHQPQPHPLFVENVGMYLERSSDVLESDPTGEIASVSRSR